jgi:hypothetical protein
MYLVLRSAAPVGNPRPHQQSAEVAAIEARAQERIALPQRADAAPAAAWWPPATSAP